jgi:hypothetical protein
MTAVAGPFTMSGIVRAADFGIMNDYTADA